jgi:Gnt-I system high-affinity gluconate transporter
VPAIVLAGPVFARFLTRVPARPPAGLQAGRLPDARLPGAGISILTALLPVVLLLGVAGVGSLVEEGSTAAGIVGFLKKPDVLMLVALLFATVSLGLLGGRSLPAVMDVYSSAIADVASILLVIAGSGAFKEVLVQTQMDKRIGEALQGLPVDPLIVGWVVTAAIRVCVGSATVAGLTAADLLAPLVSDGSTDPNLMVLAIGSGSLACSHVNDAGFWLFKEYFNVSLGDTLRSWTVMETIVAVVGLAGVLVLARLI